MVTWRRILHVGNALQQRSIYKAEVSPIRTAAAQSSSTVTVHYPGYPSSPARAAHTLGGLAAIAKVRSPNPSPATAYAPALVPRLELRFRPEDPYCDRAFDEVRTSTGLLLRLSRPKGGCAPPRAEVVARVRSDYHFEGMADFQHVVPVHAAEVRKRNRLDCPNVKDDLGNGSYHRPMHYPRACKGEQYSIGGRWISSSTDHGELWRTKDAIGQGAWTGGGEGGQYLFFVTQKLQVH